MKANICLSALAILVTFTGCRKQSAPTTQPVAPQAPETCSRQAIDKELLRIAVIPKGTSHIFWKTVHAGAARAAEELPDVEVIWQGPLKEDDREQQINVVDNFINAGIDGMVLAPLDDKALLKPVREATAAGIGVVIMDSGLAGRGGTDFASFVATDNFEGGRKAGHRLAEVMGKIGEVILMRYAVGSASNERREEGFLEAIAEYPEIEVISSDQRAGVTSESAQNKADSLLQRFPDLDGAFCPNEPTTFGMLRALEEAGRAGTVRLVGFDTSDKLIRAMRDDKVHGLVLQDPYNMGKLAVETTVAYLRGETVRTRIDTGCTVATAENMDNPDIQRLLSPPVK
jgi:ribose transport system substrate-binding protein